MQTYTAASGMIYPIADSNTPLPSGKSLGYEGRDTTRYPRAALPKSARWSGNLIDPSEYEDRIREKTAKKTWIADRCDAVGLKVKDQGNSNYCWIHAPTHGMEVWYALNSLQVKVLSAFYAGAIIQGGRNSGGSGVTGVEFLMKNGTPLESYHPPGNFSTNNTADAVANAKLHIIDSALEFDPGDLAVAITSAFNDQPFTVGIPGWSHEVLVGTFLVFDKNLYSWNNGVGFGFDNSWSPDWGTNGRGILSRNYTRWDEAMIITGCTPAQN